MASTAARIHATRTQARSSRPSTPRPPVPLRAIELSSSELEPIGSPPPPPSGPKLAPRPPLRASRSDARRRTQTGVHEEVSIASRGQVHTIPLSSVDLELSSIDLEPTASGERRSPPPPPKADTTAVGTQIQSAEPESIEQNRRVRFPGRLGKTAVACVVMAAGVLTFLHLTEPQTASSLETAGGETSFLALSQPQPVSPPVPVVRAHHTTVGPVLSQHARSRSTIGNVVSVNQKKTTTLAALAPSPSKKLAYSKVADLSSAPSKK